jgi:hypothetical protein
MANPGLSLPSLVPLDAWTGKMLEYLDPYKEIFPGF